METEQELFVLMKAAKEQQAAVERATQAMQQQRGELYEAIAQLNKLRTNVATEAKQGVERGLAGVTGQANAALIAEVEKAKRTIGDVAEDLRVRAWAKSFKWLAGSLAVGFALGFGVCWFMWGRDARDAVKRFDYINAAMERQVDKQMQEQAPPAAAKTKPHSSNGNRP